MPPRTEPKLIAGFVVVLIAIIVNVFVSSANMDTVSTNREAVAHTHEVLTELEGLVSDFTDATVWERGYVITGRVDDLAPYSDTTQAIDKRLAHLRHLIGDNPVQQRHLTELEPQKQVLLALLQRVIEARSAQGEAAARRLILTGHSRETIAGIRKIIERMEAEEQRLLVDRRSESEASEHKTRLTFYGATAASMALLYVTFLQVAHAFADRRQAAEAIQRREEWLSTTLNSIGDAVMATDDRGHVLFMNPIAEDLTGWKQNDAEGKSAREVFHIINEETRAEVLSPIAKAIAHGIVVGLANHTVLIAKDGTERPIEDSGAPIRDTNGKLIGVVLVFRDVTGRREIEIERERYVTELDQLRNTGLTDADGFLPVHGLVAVEQPSDDLCRLPVELGVNGPVATKPKCSKLLLVKKAVVLQQLSEFDKDVDHLSLRSDRLSKFLRKFVCYIVDHCESTLGPEVISAVPPLPASPNSPGRSRT